MPVLPTWTRAARALRAAAALPALPLVLLWGRIRALLLALARPAVGALSFAPSLASSLALATALLPAAAATAAEPPHRLLTDLAALRRCSDQLLVDYGVRDLVVQLAEVDERAARGAGGLRELLPAAAGDLTPRSRALRLSSAAGERAPLSLRATLRRDALAAGGEAFTLDLALESTADRAPLPGGSMRHTVVLADGRAELQKFGTRLSLPAQGADAASAPLRLLADAAVIELAGRLARVPYWTCLGASLAEPAVAAEVQDWYDTMATRPSELIAWFQHQLRLRRAYDGPADGEVSPALKEAVARYRERLGLSREPKLSIDFFHAWLAADHRGLAAQAPAAQSAEPARPSPAPSAQPAPAFPAPSPAPSSQPPATALAVAPRPVPLDLRIAAPGGGFVPGQAVRLDVRPSRDAHVYCFLQDEARRITRFFPNRFQRDSRVSARAGVQLPGAMRFEITMNALGVTETVACFGTEHDVLAALPAELSGADFAALPVASFDQLRQAFLAVTDGTLAQESFAVRARR